MEGNRVIITVLGRDRVGIIAGLTLVLAQHNVNIVDIRQTIVQEFFTMIMVADVSRCTVDLHTLQEKMDRCGADLGVQVKVQHEKVFQYMHRI